MSAKDQECFCRSHRSVRSKHRLSGRERKASNQGVRASKFQARAAIEAEFGRSGLHKNLATGEQCDPTCRSGSSCPGVFSFCRAYRCSRKLSDFTGAPFKGTRVAIRVSEVHQMPRLRIPSHKAQVHGVPQRDPPARGKTQRDARHVAASGSYQR